MELLMVSAQLLVHTASVNKPMCLGDLKGQIRLLSQNKNKLSTGKSSSTDNLKLSALKKINNPERITKSKHEYEKELGPQKFACHEGNRRQWQCVLREVDVNAPAR